MPASMLRAILATLGSLLLPLPFAHAQSAYPNKPIRFVVPNPAGGLPDTVARIIGPKLGERLGPQIIVDNRPGDNRVAAGTHTSSSTADGSTFLAPWSSTFTVDSFLYAKLVYDAQ